MYDIAIIGLGPAGSTLARLLDSKFSVVALDKKSHADSAGFHKPCGGLLALDAQKALSKFNLTLPKQVLVDPQIFAVKTIDAKQKLLRHYQRFYINMDRDKFDKWLISLIPPQVEVVGQAVCTKIEKTAAGYDVTYLKEGGLHKISARYLVGADGSDSLVRKSLFPQRRIRRYLAIQQWFAEKSASPFYSCVFDSRLTDSYCWSISKDGRMLLGGAFPIKKGKENFRQLKSTLTQQGFVLGQPLKTEACLISMPRGLRDFCLGNNGAFLLGEAAGFISPSSLEGISYALDTAHTLALTLNARTANPNRRYRLRTLPLRLKLLAKLLKVPFMYWPCLRKVVMKSGLKAIRVVND